MAVHGVKETVGVGSANDVDVYDEISDIYQNTLMSELITLHSQLMRREPLALDGMVAGARRIVEVCRRHERTTNPDHGAMLIRADAEREVSVYRNRKGDVGITIEIPGTDEAMFCVLRGDESMRLRDFIDEGHGRTIGPSSLIDGLSDHDLAGLLGRALLQEWPKETPLSHVIRAAGGELIAGDESLASFVERT